MSELNSQIPYIHIPFLLIHHSSFLFLTYKLTQASLGKPPIPLLAHYTQPKQLQCQKEVSRWKRRKSGVSYLARLVEKADVQVLELFHEEVGTPCPYVRASPDVQGEFFTFKELEKIAPSTSHFPSSLFPFTFLLLFPIFLPTSVEDPEPTLADKYRAERD
jgi:hypothetical protein